MSSIMPNGTPAATDPAGQQPTSPASVTAPATIDTPLIPATPAATTPSAAAPATPGTEPAAQTPATQDATQATQQQQQPVANPEAQRYAAEAAANRKALRDAEKRIAEFEAEKQAAEDAKLSEIERAQKRATEAERQLADKTRAYQERIITNDIELHAMRLHVVDTDAAAKLLDWAALEYDDDGLPTNAEALLTQLLAAKPWLVAAPPTPTTPTPPASSGPTTPTDAQVGATNAPRANTGPVIVTPDQFLSAEFKQQFRAQYGVDLVRAINTGKAKIV